MYMAWHDLLKKTDLLSDFAGLMRLSHGLEEPWFFRDIIKLEPLWQIAIDMFIDSRRGLATLHER